MALLAPLAMISVLCSASCGGGLGAHSEVPEEAGSCEIACDHYEYCKVVRDAAREEACISECRNIFTEDGHVDGDSLRELEELSCRQIISFIEGRDSRPPGSPEN